MKKTIWIVDGAYLMQAAPGRFDYGKLRTILEEINGMPFSEAYYFNSANNGNNSSGQDAFHTWLKSAPPHGPKMRVKLYKPKLLRNRCPKCGNEFDRVIQKGVDVGIATLIVKLAAQNKYDRLFLSSGDGDFEDAVAFIKEELDKDLFVSGFADSLSSDLQSYASEVIWLDQHWENFKR